jgi:hypothetical protein
MLAGVILLIFPSVTSADFVFNGGFETGDFTGWILSGNPIPGNVDTMAHSGMYAANLFADGSLGYMDQFLPTNPGALYNLTFYLQSDGGTPNEFLAQVAGTTLFQELNIPAQNYALYSFFFQATTTSTDLKFGFRNDPGSFHLDDISVTAVPEPASVWLGSVVTAMAILTQLARRSRRDLR